MNRKARTIIEDVYKETYGLRTDISSSLTEEILSASPEEIITHVFSFGEAFYERFLLIHSDLWDDFSALDWLRIFKNQMGIVEYQVAIISFLNKFVGVNFLGFVLTNMSKYDSRNLIEYLEQIPGVLLRNEDVIKVCFDELPTSFESQTKRLLKTDQIENSFMSKEEISDFLRRRSRPIAKR